MTNPTDSLEALSSSLRGVDAVVTGASRGLGLGFARVLAAAGARVWMTSELESELHQAADQVVAEGGAVEVRVVDLLDRDEVADFAIDVRAKASRLRAVVNAAAILEFVSGREMTADHWDRTIAINLTAPMLLTRDLLPGLARDGGSIINVSSRAGIEGFVDESAYCASKFGLEGLTRCLALELADAGISANTLSPGVRIKPTSLTTEDVGSVSPEERAEWNDPVILAPAFLYLASLRGNPSGYRFDAFALTRALEKHGPEYVSGRPAEFAQWSPPTNS